MTTFVMVAFFVLLAAEALAAGAGFLVYLRQPGWRETEVGRHLAAYMGTLFGLYVVTFAAIFVRNMLMNAVLLASHVAFTAVLWQRVWLVWKGQRGS